MRIMMAVLSAAILAACGFEETVPNGEVTPENKPPNDGSCLLINADWNICGQSRLVANLQSGQFTTFKVGGATFTVLKFDDNNGEIKVRNDNDNRARVQVMEVLTNSDNVSVVIDVMALKPGGEASNSHLTLQKFYRIKVDTWKDDIVDLAATCRFNDGSWKNECFLARGNQILELK